MDLEKRVDCDGTCFSIYPNPGAKLIPHEEVEREFDRMLFDFDETPLKSKFWIGYRLTIAHIKEKSPEIYTLLRKIGLPKPYKSPYEL